MEPKKLKEQWMSTSILSSFRMPSLTSLPDKDNVVLTLPLSNLGWSFSTTLNRNFVTEDIRDPRGKAKKITSKLTARWKPSILTFHSQDSSIPWESTSMTAELRLGYDSGCGLCCTRFPEPSSVSCSQCHRSETGSTLLGTLQIALANNHSAEIPLESGYLAPALYNVGLVVTIKDCPFVDGLFRATSDYLRRPQAPPQTKDSRNDDIMCRSLTTGTPFDVTFLTFATRHTLGLVDKPIPTHGLLSVIEQQIDISSAKLQEEWTNAFSVADGHNNTREIVSPAEYDHDLDSDYEDDDVTSSIPPSLPNEFGDSSEGDRSGDETKRSCSSVVVIESAEATDEDSIDHNPADVIKVSEARLPSSSATSPESERGVLVKFAAHKTWHAFLWYCYTGSVKFGKLKSQVEPGVPKQDSEQQQDGPPVCSPKSMYRLADLLGSGVLKAKALEAIQESMTETNVIEEAFSEFTSKYSEVQDVQLRALLEHCQTEDVKTGFLRMVLKSHTMPHAQPMLSAFYDKLTASYH